MLLFGLTACADSGDTEAVVEARLQSMSLVERASLLVAVPVSFDDPPAEIVRRIRTAVADSNSSRPGGLWIESASAEGLAAARAELPLRWSPLLALSSDNGVGGVVAGATRFPPLSDLARAGWDPDELRQVGRAIAEEAASRGISLTTVASMPILEGSDPLFLLRDSTALAERYTALFAGADERGAPLALRLYWSPDSLLVDTNWDRTRFEIVEGAVLTGALKGGLDAVMLGRVALPALDPESAPTARSRAVIRGTIRRDAGFHGLVVSDLRHSVGNIDPVDALVASIRSGADLVVTGVDPAVGATGLVAAVTAGTLPQSRIDTAARRVLTHMAQRDRAREAEGEGEEVPTPGESSEAAELADAANRFLLLARGASTPPTVTPGIRGEGGSGGLAPADADSAGMSTDDLAAIGRTMRAALADSVFTAGAVVAIRHGVVAFAEAFGTSSGGTPAGLDTTIFDLASLTKVVGTTTAVSILLDRGEIRLDDPVVDYLPDFRGEGKAGVTIRHLLTHTSGLASGIWLYGSASSPEEAIRDVLEHRLARAPGEEVVYSDLGFILLAEIVERVTGTGIDRFLAAELFVPLGMSSTMYLPPAHLFAQVVPTAGENERPYPLTGVVHDANSFRLGGVAGHAGIFSTASDLAVFAEMMLANGRAEGVRILTDSIVELVRGRQEGAEERALGWDTPADVSSAGRFASARTFGHTGYTGTSLWIDPEYDLAVILLTNRTYPAAGSREILELRTDIHETIYQSINDREVPRRRGAR